MVLKAGRLIYTFHNVVVFILFPWSNDAASSRVSLTILLVLGKLMQGLDIPLSLPDIPPNPNLNWANLICAGQEH